MCSVNIEGDMGVPFQVVKRNPMLKVMIFVASWSYMAIIRHIICNKEPNSLERAGLGIHLLVHRAARLSCSELLSLRDLANQRILCLVS